jgi:2-desacetyl-2-hydroxyethyl bacteriochlorophyllide A dehydrogenase
VRAVVLEAPRQFSVTEIDEPDPAGRAVVALEQVGICGTDLKIAKGDIPVDYPRILGHELIGRVVTPGPRGLVEAGARVLVDPAIACGHCHACRDDRANICSNGALLGRDLDGGFADRIAVDELQLHPIPDALPPSTAALVQVLGTCVHAQAGIRILPPDTAVVIGLGVAGLLHLQLLRARGIRRVVGIGRSEWKRQLALEFGATAVATPDQAVDVVREVAGSDGPTVVIEAVGTVPTLAQAIEMVGAGGTVLVFGTVTASDGGSLPYYQLYYKELTILNPRAALPRDYDRAIALALAGEVSLDRLWTRSYPLEEAQSAFDRLLRDGGGTDSLKVTFELGVGVAAASGDVPGA